MGWARLVARVPHTHLVPKVAFFRFLYDMYWISDVFCCVASVPPDLPTIYLPAGRGKTKRGENANEKELRRG